MMTPTSPSPGLSRFALLTAVATLGLIGLGGLVTSHGAGLSVPDWPTTYGYNMFFFPVSQWVGGIFYEHTHRLLASLVGLLTLVLAAWLWWKEPRAWLRWLGIAAAILVVVQGVLGGLRVTELLDELGIVHATLAQLFLVLLSAIALGTSSRWVRFRGADCPADESRRLRRYYGMVTLLVLLQLMVGATMRHQHAGLAIPDFPAAYGRLWPAMDAAAIAAYNQDRQEVSALNAITAFQVALHMGHRLLALLILLAVGRLAFLTQKRVREGSLLKRLAWTWLALILTQVFLGAATVWTNKSADIVTLHVVVGAASLVAGSGLALWAHRGLLRPAPGQEGIPNHAAFAGGAAAGRPA